VVPVPMKAGHANMAVVHAGDVVDDDLHRTRLRRVTGVFLQVNRSDPDPGPRLSRYSSTSRR
jgi:hypothetical protein